MPNILKKTKSNNLPDRVKIRRKKNGHKKNPIFRIIMGNKADSPSLLTILLQLKILQENTLLTVKIAGIKPAN